MELFRFFLLYFYSDRALLLIFFVILLSFKFLFLVLSILKCLSLGFGRISRGQPGPGKFFQVRVLVEEFLVTYDAVDV